MNRATALCLIAASSLAMSACAPDVADIFSDTSNPGTGGDGGEGGQTTSTTGEGGGGGGTTSSTSGTTSSSSSSSTTSSSSSSSTTVCDPGGPNDDADGDGFTEAEGDCHDCAYDIGPNALEIPGNAIDENCSGGLDEPLNLCDGALPIDHDLPVEAARAVELCKAAIGPANKGWGVTGAEWVLADGSPAPQGPQGTNFHLGHGVLPDFGPNVKPRAGVRVLALSNGTARRPTDPGFQSLQGFQKGYASPPPPGFPKESPECNSVSGGPNDATSLSVSIRVPTNAHGFSYDFSFYAYDFPDYVCSQYNDAFYAILTPPAPGFADANVAYDELGNPVTLNGAHFRVCACNGGPCTGGGKQYQCPLGDMQLIGTGFDPPGQARRGATGWLTTKVPVEPGSEIQIRWGVYDAGDGSFDSTVILDNWKWITTPGVTAGTAIAQ